MNVYAGAEGESVGVDLRGSALLVGEPSAVYSRGKGALVGPAGSVDVLSFRIIVVFFIDLLVAGVGGETGDVEGSTWSGGVGHVGGSGADTAGAKTSEEGSTVALL